MIGGLSIERQEFLRYKTVNSRRRAGSALLVRSGEISAYSGKDVEDGSVLASE